MTRSSSTHLNSMIYAEAAEWFVTCRSGALDDAMRRKFDSWLRQSPQHLSAYLEIAAIWDEGPGLDTQHRWDTETLIAEARADRSNVVPLTQSPESEEPSSGSSRIRWLAASIATIAVGIVALLWMYLSQPPLYVADIGEQRSIALPDGSTIELNSRSKVRVRYSDHERALDLIEGQALFSVAKDASRPFIVSSGGTRVRAVGTLFDVHKKREGTVVTVVEGRVAVLTNVPDASVQPLSVEVAEPSMPQLKIEGQAGSARDPSSVDPSNVDGGILLGAGEQITVTETEAKQIVRPDVNRAISWTQRQLVFERATLTEVAEEFNRYNARRLIVQDPDLYEFHISGVFASTDPGALLQFLRERTGVQVIETETAIYLTKKTATAR